MDDFSRIKDMFGKDQDLLNWILEDSLSRTSAILLNLDERERQFLYRYCVLNQSLEDIDTYFRTDPQFQGLESVPIGEEMERVRSAIVSRAPSLLSKHRKKRQRGLRPAR